MRSHVLNRWAEPTIQMLNRWAEPHDSTSILEALPGKFDIKRHSPSSLYVLTWFRLRALPVDQIVFQSQFLKKNPKVKINKKSHHRIVNIFLH